MKKWYLNSKFVFILCLLTPPIGYLHIFLNRHKWERNEMINHLTLATFAASFWVLKFISREVQLVALILTIIFFLLSSKK
ncbi:hypothetical protein [Brevibacillus borstelensis]|uniref:hypothetical protein n=1 Tax=Brevibacillus borstelensis TaxID=45462 RepID=UPI0030C6352E